jgi:hypothetical protein
VIDEVDIRELRVLWLEKILAHDAQIPELADAPSDAGLQPRIAGDASDG